MFLVKNNFYKLFSYKLLLPFSIITIISIYFSFFSWFFFVIFLILSLFILSKSIFFHNQKVFYLIIGSFFIKFFFSELLYVYFELKGYPLGTIGGSDDISYFLKGKIIAEFLRNGQIFDLNERLYSTNLTSNEFFYHFNALIVFIDTNLSLMEIAKLPIFFNTLASLILYYICDNFNLNKKCTFLIIFLFVVDLKVNFYSFFNLKEPYLLFSSICCIYICGTIITANFKNKNILTISIIGLLLSFFFRFQFFLINVFLIFLTVLFYLFFIKKIFNITKLKIIYFFIFIIFGLVILNPYYSIINYNDLFYQIYFDNKNLDNSISNKIYSLKYSDNIFYILVHFFAGLIGIFPIFKDLNAHLTFQLYAQVWTHLLIIISMFALTIFLKNLKKISYEVRLFIILVFIKASLILFLSTIVSFGSLVFFRYSLFLNILLIFFVGISIENCDLKKIIAKSAFIYLMSNLILLLPYYLIKSNLI